MHRLCAKWRTAALRQRARAVVHHDRIDACLDDSARHAHRVLELYRTSFPAVFGPLRGRRAGEQDSSASRT